MHFNSLDFALFLPLVFAVYWSLGSKRRLAQNAFLVLASYFFYGYWDPRFLLLIAASSAIDFVCAQFMRTKSDGRKIWLAISLFSNLGILAFFKYFNFFLDSLAHAFLFFGQPIQMRAWEIILPVGISFYTFQTISYSVDVYKGKIEPSRSPIDFFAYVSFFPQLVAGPIERATRLLPQFQKTRTFCAQKAGDGLKQILWGLFLKMVIADSCAIYANMYFDNYETFNGSTLLLGSILFAFQIYGDFAGYSLIAIGTAKLFGFDLMKNFNLPYFSKSIAEFWQRWHISLSTWFRDYVYIPLGGNRRGLARQVFNVFVVFLISGLWHGDNWTFVLWGGFHAVLFLPSILRKKQKNQMHLLWSGFAMLGTFTLVSLGWVLFRSETIGQAGAIYQKIFSASLFEIPQIIPKRVLGLVIFMLVLTFLQKKRVHTLDLSSSVPIFARWAIYFVILFMVLLLSAPSQDFIYFQF